MDMNVEDAWEQGYSGKGVAVTILDDGIEHTHGDLKDNYDEMASVDINDEDDDPFPRYDIVNSNKHGTRCAGTVAASANNSFCAVGIAYDAGIGGIRILDGQVDRRSSTEVTPLSTHYSFFYNCRFWISWKPAL